MYHSFIYHALHTWLIKFNPLGIIYNKTLKSQHTYQQFQGFQYKFDFYFLPGITSFL